MEVLQSPKPWRIGLVLIIGMLGISTAAVFARLALTTAGIQDVGFSLLIAAARLTISAILLLPAWYNFRASSPSSKSIKYALAAGLCLSLHFAAWITSLSLTSIAASSTLVSTTPIWIALFSWLWFRERLTVASLLGISIAFTGGLLIASGDFEVDAVGSHALLGNALALFGAWMYSLYLLLGRKAQQEGLGLGIYVAIAYGTGALILLPLPGILGTAYTGHPAIVYVYMLLIAVLSQTIGHTSVNWAIRWLSPTIVTLATLFEPIGSSFLGYVLLGERLEMLTMIGAAILLIGVACVIVGEAEKSS
jgi:drug/metabolite transporter (DMT)-like permease